VSPEVIVSHVEIRPLRLGRVTLPDFHPAAPGVDPIQAFLVRDGDDRILVDTGVGAGNDLIDGLYRPDLVSLPDALAELDVRVGDVAAVVNSHLHFDHCGNNRLFPGVPIFVQQDELEASRQPHYTVPEWVDFPGACYRPIRGRHALSAHLELIPTPGHTPGHQSLVARSAVGVEIVVAQAAYSSSEYALVRERAASDPVLEPHLRLNASWSRERYLASLDALERLRPNRAYFSHDQKVWERTDR
jgi:glyoxylase-like metal-dependent hydrolase (beta-lactamase superfamily II)